MADNSTPSDEFTAEDAALLAALNAKRMKQQWASDEAVRLSKLEAFGNLTKLMNGKTVGATIEALNAALPNVDRDTYQRLDRVLSIMMIDGTVIGGIIDALSTPAPMPGDSVVAP